MYCLGKKATLCCCSLTVPRALIAVFSPSPKGLSHSCTPIVERDSHQIVRKGLNTTILTVQTWVYSCPKKSTTITIILHSVSVSKLVSFAAL